MRYKIDGPNVTQKVWWSIDGLVVDLPILFLVVFQIMEGHKRLSQLFSGNLAAVFVATAHLAESRALTRYICVPKF